MIQPRSSNDGYKSLVWIRPRQWGTMFRSQQLLNFLAVCVLFQVSLTTPSHRIYREERNCSGSNGFLKMELLKLTQRLANSTNLQIGPGMLLTRTDRTATIENRLRPLAVSSLPLRPFLGKLLTAYIDSLNITFQLGESAVLAPLRSFSLQLWNPSSARGRSKHKYRTGWYALRIIATVGFAMLAALCGKALMASILALALSAVVALRAGGFAFASPGKVTQYEIISKPAYATAPATNYYDHEHYHITSPYSYNKRDVEVSKDN